METVLIVFYFENVFRVGGAYGSLARCGVLPAMSPDVYIITIEDSGGVRRVSTSKVATSGTQPLPRAYASLVLMTSGSALHFIHTYAFPSQQPHHLPKHGTR